MKSTETKRSEAESRQRIHKSLTTEEKIAKLDKKFGVGKGATKERTKLDRIWNI